MQKRRFAVLFCLATVSLSSAAVSLEDPIDLVPLTPTECHQIEVSAYIPIGPLVSEISHTLEGNLITVQATQDGLDLNPNPPQVINQCIGQLAPGEYTVRFQSQDVQSSSVFYYETRLEVMAADCDQAAAGIPLNISNGELEILDAETILVSNVRLPCAAGHYWGSFRWNPNAFSWDLQDVGAQEPAPE